MRVQRIGISTAEELCMPATTRWTRHQMLVALNLYCQMPFGKMHHRNPDIVKWSELIGRTPSALAMKLTNFASLDPAITSTGRKGLANVSTADQALWHDMHNDWERFTVEAQDAINSLGGASIGEADVDLPDMPDEAVEYGASDKTGQTKIRVGQNFFRRAVLSAYDYRCCITGLNVPSLLIASHIVPWRVDEGDRLNPRNGLCLSALHDKSFDAGIIAITEQMTVKISPGYASTEDRFFEAALSAYDGQPIVLPKKFRPDPEFLAYHRQHVFQP